MIREDISSEEAVTKACKKVQEKGRAFRHLSSFLYKVLDKMCIKGKSKREYRHPTISNQFQSILVSFLPFAIRC